MTFPDGSVKEGRFENNVFIVPPSNEIKSEVESNSNTLMSNVSPIITTKKLQG